MICLHTKFVENLSTSSDVETDIHAHTQIYMELGDIRNVHSFLTKEKWAKKECEEVEGGEVEDEEDSSSSWWLWYERVCDKSGQQDKWQDELFRRTNVCTAITQ
jgi:hypothetical protein